jgi:SulP family sulfate permease
VNARPSRRSVLVPKLVTDIQTYDRQQFIRDAIAGVVVGIVALPLCIAFAIASGVTPDRGLWTGIVAGFLISLLGGSKVQIGGPTGAFVVVVYGIVQKYGVDGLTVATLMAGVILIGFGIFKFGAAIKFIPYPVTMGFTSGIAVIIATGQIKDFLGLRMGAVPADFMEKLGAYAANVGGLTPAAVGVSLFTLAVIILWPRVSMKIPSPFVALILATAGVQMFHLPVETIASRFGDVTASLPHPQIPHITLAQATALIGPAFTIAMLGAIESLLSAVVSDGMIGSRHRSNMELVAQGVANLAAPLVGGIPATGAIARTATNVKNGGRTPVAGIVHALTLLVITLAAGRWAGLIPMSALAAILIMVAYTMSEWRAFVGELRSPKSDVAVLLATFLLTVFVDLTVAIEVGMVLAAFLFIRRMASVANVSAVTRELEDDNNGDASDPGDVSRRRIPPGVEVYEINGPFFFGAAEVFKDTLSQIVGKPKVLIIRMRHVTTIDSTGMHALRDVVHRSRKEGTAVLLSDVHGNVAPVIKGSSLVDDLGDDGIFDNIDDALTRARQVLGVA